MCDVRCAMIEDISGKRWFMGKGRPIHSIEELDSIPLGGTKVSILQVRFESDKNDECDYYCVIEDESKIGAVLAEYFGPKFPKEKLLHAQPLNAEQSNSAFYSKGEFFFKLYRRLQVGEHPEAERTVLEVRESNTAAIGLYTSMGFADAGRRKRFYRDPEEDAVIMVLDMK